MFKSISRITALLVLLIVSTTIFAQTDGTYTFTDANVQMTFPQEWSINELSNGDVHFYEIDFDRTSGQQPRGAIFKVSVVEKTDDMTLEDAFPVIVKPSDLEPYVVEDLAMPTLQADTTLAGNVSAARLLIDADDNTWLYIQITNSDKEIVDTVLASLSAIGGEETSAEAGVLCELPEDALISVVLISDNGNMSVNDVVRDLLEIGMADARNLINSAPDAIIIETQDEVVVQDAVNKLEGVGASVEIRVGESVYKPFVCDSSLYSVVITAVGENKIDVIKAVTGIAGLGLSHAKGVVETEPEGIVIEGVSEDVALAAQTELETAGATVEVRAGGDGMSDMADILCELPEDALISVVLVSTNGNNLSVIKAVRTITGLGLAEAKDLVDAVPATVIEAVDATVAQSAVDELQAVDATVEMRVDDIVYNPAGCVETMDGSGLYDVVITEVGTSKINVIKAVRGLTGLGLAEAKDVVESVSGIVLTGVDIDAANTAKVDLETAGATVTLTELP